MLVFGGLIRPFAQWGYRWSWPYHSVTGSRTMGCPHTIQITCGRKAQPGFKLGDCKGGRTFEVLRGSVQYNRARFVKNSSSNGSKPLLISASTRSIRYWPHFNLSRCQRSVMAAL